MKHVPKSLLPFYRYLISINQVVAGFRRLSEFVYYGVIYDTEVKN